MMRYLIFIQRLLRSRTNYNSAVLIKHTPASVLNEVEGEFKVFTVAIVWIGNRSPSLILVEVVGHANNLAALSVVVRLTADVMVVFIVHDHDEVKVGKVVTGIKLARDMVNVVSSLCAMKAHALIRQLPYVPRSYSCRIDIRDVLKIN